VHAGGDDGSPLAGLSGYVFKLLPVWAVGHYAPLIHLLLVYLASLTYFFFLYLFSLFVYFLTYLFL